jgi:very-short-patch-repair endonuclease
MLWRDARLQAAGYRVMRVTWRQILEQPEALVARVAQALVRL